MSELACVPGFRLPLLPGRFCGHSRFGEPRGGCAAARHAPERTFDEAADAQWVGQGVKLYTADGKEVVTVDGVVAIIKNGERILNPN